MRKFLSVFIIGIMILSLVSCGEVDKERVRKAAQAFMEDTLSGQGLEENARTDLIKRYLKQVDYEITQIDAAEDGSYEVKIDLTNTVNPRSEEAKTAVAGREDEYIDALKKSPKTVTLKFAQVKGDDFDPVNPKIIKDLLYETFDQVSVTDKDGNPLVYTEGYLDSLYAGAFWYDPLLNNPLLSDTISTPMALRLAVYFSRPVSIDYMVRFYKDGEEIGSIGSKAETSPIKFAELQPSDLGKESFEPGEYKAVVLFDGRYRKETGVLKVQ